MGVSEAESSPSRVRKIGRYGAIGKRKETTVEKKKKERSLEEVVSGSKKNRLACNQGEVWTREKEEGSTSPENAVLHLAKNGEHRARS